MAIAALAVQPDGKRADAGLGSDLVAAAHRELRQHDAVHDDRRDLAAGASIGW
jgi:hypothetical protein